MFSHISLLFLSLLTHSICEDCLLNLITKEDAWDKVLHRDKMENYDVYEPPNNQSVIVSFEFRTFALDEYKEKFTAILWTRMTWSDERLTWSPENYGGISQMVVRRTDIWHPYLRLLNRAERSLYWVKFSECIVFHRGEILCIPEIVYESHCSVKLSGWPYDVQYCSLQFRSGRRCNVTRFHFDKRAVIFSSADLASGWNITLANSKEDPSPNVQVSISLSIERQASGLVIILVGPCLIICILTTTSILLNVSDSTRLAFTCFSLISHFVFLSAIDEFIPKHSSDVPDILFFIRGSIILTITSLLFSYIISIIVKIKNVPFVWVSSVTNRVFGSFVKYLIFPTWYVKTDPGDVISKNNEIWTKFASILNSVYLVIVVIVYIVLFISYMPKKPTARN